MELSDRQRQFADAGLEIVAREGMTAVSFRSVAAEAGMSLGAVQKAFATKEQLLGAMLSRLREASAALPPGEPGRPTLYGWLAELLVSVLPLDDTRRAATLRSSAFAELAVREQSFADVLRAGDDTIIGLLAMLVRRAIAEGELEPEIDPELTARAWVALGTGLANQLLYAPRPEAEVRREVERLLARLLGLT